MDEMMMGGKKDDDSIMIDLLKELIQTMRGSSMDRMSPKTADASGGDDMSMDSMKTGMDDKGMNPNAQDGETVMADGSDGDDMDPVNDVDSGDDKDYNSDGPDMADKGSKYRGNRLLARLNMKG